MKTLIVSFYYSPELGAAPSRITNMAEGLKQKGVDVDVLTCLPNYPKGEIFEGYKKTFFRKENINGINCYRYWTYATVSKKAVARLFSMFSFALTMWSFAFKRKQIKAYDYVIVQSPPILVAFSAMLLFGCLYKKKMVLNVSDLWPGSAVELGAVREGGGIHKFMLWIERFIYKHSYLIQGQSNEILKHIEGFVPEKKKFLYRNLQHSFVFQQRKSIKREPFKIVYAGLLGEAQNILGIIKQINFKELGAEFHLYGGGTQAQHINEFIEKNDVGVYYHGYLEKQKMVETLTEYNASIVPLLVSIKGAVPSKIFDLLPVGVPILFCGSGEGAEIIKEYNIGLVSSSGDIKGLKCNIQKMIAYSDEDYIQIKNNCINASQNDFSFEEQMNRYYEFLRSNIKETTEV